MTGTIESINNNILNKIQCLKEIYNYIKNQNIPLKMYSEKELQEISEEYEMGSIKILSNYFLLMREFKDEIQKYSSEEIRQKKIEFNTKKDKFHKDYHFFIKRESFVGKLDRLRDELKNIINSKKIKNVVKMRDFFAKYDESSIIYDITATNYIMCSECDREMKILATSSELVCVICGKTENLTGTVFEDEQFYYQEGQRTKHGSYDPSKHCRFWIERIQARESKTIPDEIINSIKQCIRQNNIRNIEDITCEQIRKYLRQIKNTSYNEHVPLIRKIITGITPPQLTDREVQLIILIFNRAIKIYEIIKPNDKTNVMYHPYLIYKIIEHILKHPNMYKRRNAILSCIHLQSRETLIENDIIWEKVCKYIDIDYISTDRNIELKIL